jgi:hypothetical protein
VSFALLVILGVVIGVVGGFAHSIQLRALGISWPIGVIAVLALLGASGRLGGRVTGSRWGSAAVVLPWLLVTFVFSAQRPEGDLVLVSDWISRSYLYGGFVLVGLLLALPPQPLRHLGLQTDRVTADDRTRGTAGQRS